MNNKDLSKEHLLNIIEDLEKRLAIAEETLEAIRQGEVDALVIFDSEGEKVFTLQGSDYVYRLLIEQMKEGAATMTPDGFILYCNQSLADLVKQPLEKVIGSNFKQFICPKDLAICHPIFNHQGEIKTFDEEINLLTGDGREIPVYLSSNELIVEHNVIHYVVVTDLSQKKQNEAALRQSEEQFRKAFEYAPIGIALVGLDGQWLKVNSSFCQIVGYPEAELLSKKFQDLTVAEDLAVNIKYINQLIRGEMNAYEIKKRYIHKDGHIVWVQLHSSLIRDSNGKPQHFITQVEDITQRELMEQMKKNFIALVSHELRTPLTSIHGSLGLLAAGIYDKAPDKMKKMLQIAATQTNRLVALVNDILSLERMDSSRYKLSKQTCNVKTLIEQSIDAMLGLAEQNSIIFKTDVANLKVWANADAIIQVLINLLNNAIKFSPPNTTIVISAELFEASKSQTIKVPKACLSSTCDCSGSFYPYVLFKIEDQGRGIPPDKLETIFEPFLQIDSSDSREKGGTGLGLAICHSIIKQHHGEIWVTSILGQGSIFYFTLPLSCQIQKP